MKKALAMVLTVLMLLSSVTTGLTALAAGTTINVVTDLGLVANNISAASDNGTKLKNSMSSCSDGTTYVFPEGTYYVDTAVSIFGSVTKGMYLSGKDDITIRGVNATVVNTSYDNTNKSYSYNSGIISANDCNNLTIEGLSFDYQDFTSVQGVLESKGSGSVTLLLDEKFTNGTYKNALTGGEFVVSVNQLTDTGTPVNEAVNTNGYTATLSGNRYTISGIDNGIVNSLSVGKTIVARFSIGTAALPTFSLQNINGLTVTDVNVYSTAADTFYATGANSDFTFRRLNIAPKSDSPTYWASNVDGIHLLGIGGDIIIDDCTFKGMGDDSLNSHSRAAKVNGVSGTTVTVVDGWDNSASLDSGWTKAGDTVRFYRSDWTLLGTATVTSFSGKSLKVDAVPSGVDTTCYVQSTTLMPSITITNSVVDGTRARAFLLRSENVTVTGNTIKNTRLAGIIMAADITQWYEMGPSANVTVSGNTFENCAVSTHNANYGVIAIKGCDDGGGQGFAAGVHKDITIEDNTFNGSSASAIYASATDGLTIKGNKYYNLSQAPHNDVATTGNSDVAIVNCNNVTTDYQDDLYQSNSQITFVDPEDTGSDLPQPSGDYDEELASMVANNYDSAVAFDNDGTVATAKNWTALSTTDIKFNNWGGENNRANTGMATDFNIKSKNTFDIAGGFTFQMTTVFNPNATTFNGADGTGHYFKFGNLKLVIDPGRNSAGAARNAGIHLYDGDTLLASADNTYAANDGTFKGWYMANKRYYHITYSDGKFSLKTDNASGTSAHEAVWTLADGTANVSAVPATISGDTYIEIMKLGGWGQYDGGDSTVVCNPKLSASFPYGTVSDFVNYLAALGKDTTEAEYTRARTLYNMAKTGSTGLIAEIEPYEKFIIACENGDFPDEGGEEGGEGGEETPDDTPSANDTELASIVINEYDSSVSFDNDGDQANAVNWELLSSSAVKFNNWSGLNNRANSTMSDDLNIKSKNEFDLANGFKFQMATNLNPDATQFYGGAGTGHYFMFGDLKVLVDPGQTGGGAVRNAGIYIYDGANLIASADTEFKANDATFKSYYFARNTYYYITYSGGKMTVKTNTHDIVWTLANGTTGVSAVPVTITADDKYIEVMKLGGFAQFGSNDTIILCDPKLSGTFPYSTVTSFTTYLSSLNKTSATEEVTRARTLFDKVKELGSVSLNNEIAPFESYIIACEEGGGEGGGEDDTPDTFDSGNLPTKFFSANTWSTDEKRIVENMSDGSIKFGYNYSASIGNFVNNGFTVQFKAVGGFEIEFRNTSASADNGYVFGYNQHEYQTIGDDAKRHFYIRRNGSDVQLARLNATNFSFNENEWHTLGVYFDDIDGQTTIRMYIDGVHLKFGSGFAHENPSAFENNTVIDGNFVDFNPIQRGNYFEINPYYTDFVAGYGMLQFRSIDATETDHLITIACVGDSITQGSCATSNGHSYPAELQRILGTEKYNVVNFGRAGATLMTATGAPYNIQNAYYRSLSYAADYTIIMLGTNDSTADYWHDNWSSYNSAEEKFEADLRALIADYQEVGSQVIIMTSPTSHNIYYPNVNNAVAVQKAVAADLGLDVIDMNTFTAGYGDNWEQYYTLGEDNLHFNDAGYLKAAEYVAEYFDGMAQKADTAITTPNKSEEIQLDRETMTPYNLSAITEGVFKGFAFWISNDANSTIIGASGASAWSYTNAYFDLGKNFELETVIEHNINPNTTYTEDGDFTNKQYTSLSVGALELRSRPLKNSNGIKSFYYELYMNGVKVGSNFVDSGTTAPNARMTYNIRFINGYIAVYRDGTEILSVSPETYAAVRGTADYAFENVRVGFGTFELSQYHRLCSFALETFSDIAADYSITASEGGKIMEGDVEFAGTATYMPGESVTLTAVAEENYLFSGWYNSDGELLSENETYKIVFEPTTIIKARFIEKAVSGMSITATSGGKITENGADFTIDGHYVTTTAELTAVTTDSAYKFVYWTLDGEIVSYETTYTVTFTESGSLVAVFADPLDQELAETFVNLKNGYEAADWTVTGDGATLKNGGIYAGNGQKANSITAVYNHTLDLTNGFRFATKFTWAYGTDGAVNYWANASKFNFGDLTFKIINSYGTGTKLPVKYELYNGATLLGTFNTGYIATNGSYSTAIEEFLNSTFTISFDGTNIKVHSSALDANNDGTAGEYVVWTLPNGSTAESVAVGEANLHEATIKLEKEWGGSNTNNVLYYSELVIDTSFPFTTVDAFDAYLNELNDSYNATSVSEARAYYDAVSDEVKAELKCAHALFAAEAALAGETYKAVYDITADNGEVYAGDVLIADADINYGETVTLTAVGHGVHFAGWYDANGNLISTVASMDVKFINTVTLVAKFEGQAATSNMTVTSTAGGKITVNGEDYSSADHYVGDAITLTAAVTDTAYQFAYWTVDDEIVSYDEHYVLTYVAEGTVTAVFNQIPTGEVIGGFKAEDWTVTGDNASIKDGAIYAGGTTTQNKINAVYNTALDLSNGFKYTTRLNYAYGDVYNYGVNYWGDSAYYQFGALKFRITNAYGTGTKTPVKYELLNGDAVIATFDTGYYANNGSYSTDIEEYLNSTFTVEFDGENIKVYSSSLDANNDGTAGEYIVWTISDTTTSESIAAGDIDFTNATITLNKGWGGSTRYNVVYLDNFSIEFPAKHAVTVTGRNGQSTTIEVKNGTNVVLADIVPFTFGYKVVGWETEDGIAITADTVTVTEALSLVPIFEVEDSDGGYTVIVEGASNTTGGTYFYNSKVTLEFDKEQLSSGEFFGGWVNAATGAVISYAEIYIFHVGSDTTVEALITTEAATPAPIVAITDMCDVIGDGSKWSFLMERTVPNEFTYIGSGFVYSATEFSNPADATRKKESQSDNRNGQFRLTINLQSSAQVYMLAYLTYADADGVEYTIYSNGGTPVRCTKG